MDSINSSSLRLLFSFKMKAPTVKFTGVLGLDAGSLLYRECFLIDGRKNNAQTQSIL
jgi:hypothetical protein